ncbi:MAG: hypothetical protein MK228_01270 [Nitrososphaerales archaeon]|nr:hypothetical protein [Nitrososphaerales archaeon]
MQKNLNQDKEKERIIRIINKVAKGLDVEAICMYGSRIAGYANEKSDYDVIFVINNYKNKVRYKYIFDKTEISAIFVDKDSLVGDAKEGKLGEFVIGRLLNPYEVLVNPEFFERVEVEYKKRIILEQTDRLQIEYRSLSEYLKIPTEFFLFHRLRFRMRIYPPVKYSYIMTYSGEINSKNVKRSLKGFNEAARILHNESQLRYEKGVVRMINKKRKSGIIISLRIIRRIINHYYIHLLAGRVNYNIALKELFSKINRKKNIKEIPQYLVEPETLLKIV